MNKFKYSFDNKRYHTLAFSNKSQGVKRFKASLNLGIGCPNQDGTKGVGGCIFCSGNSQYFASDKSLSVEKQLEIEAKRIWKKHPTAQLTAYFQAGSNTYGGVERLAKAFDEAMGFKAVGAISVATRPDCISADMEKLLGDYAKKIPLTVELGLQTTKDETAKIINRCYEYKEFEACFNNLRAVGVNICVHIINGLPKETVQDMLNTASTVGRLKPNGVKIHLLHVIKGTALEKMYLGGNYTPMGFEAYVSTVVKQLELLPPEVVIERITGDGDQGLLVAPLWSKDKIKVLGTIDKIMAKNDTYQGRLAK